MLRGLNYWIYLGNTKKSCLAYEDRVSVDNLSVLLTESVVMTNLCVVSSALLLFRTYDFLKNIALFLAAFTFMMIYVLALRITKVGAIHFSKEVNRLIIAFQVVLYTLTIFLGVYDRSGYAVLFVGAVLLNMVSFDFLPLKNVILFCIAATGYIIAGLLIKSRTVFVQDIINITAVAIVSLFISWRKSKDKWEHEECVELIARNNTLLYRSSTTDVLTGLSNRRKAFDEFEVMSAQASVSYSPICCMILDIDYFKKFNDTYGHPQGDKLLEALGQMFLALEQKYDISFARIGGEEFMCFFIPAKGKESRKIAETILEGVRKLPHPDKENGLYTTISIGICECVPGFADTGNRLYVKADSALYEAKKNGRNRIEYYDVKVDKV